MENLKKNIIITDKRATTGGPFKLIVFTERMCGFRCSEQAVYDLEYNYGNNTISTVYDCEIVWVSIDEFRDHELVEFEIPNILCEYNSFGSKF